MSQGMGVQVPPEVPIWGISASGNTSRLHREISGSIPLFSIYLYSPVSSAVVATPLHGEGRRFNPVTGYH